jgi:proline dehydrogenase
MWPPLPGAPPAHTPAHYGSVVSVLTRPQVHRLVERPLVGRVLAGRLVAGPRAEDGVRVAVGLVDEGWSVALDHRPGAGDDGRTELSALIARAQAAELTRACELTVPAVQQGDARYLAAAAAEAGLRVAFDGAPGRVDALLAEHPGSRAVVRSGEPGAPVRCRDLGGRVRLRAGSGAAARLAFVRCVDVLMSGDGDPAVATGDPRLIAIAGERAAWHGRASDSWEYVMPWRVRPFERQRLAAAGARVRVSVVSGPGAAAALLGRAGGSR